jgi:hypothetical protein
MTREAPNPAWLRDHRAKLTAADAALRHQRLGVVRQVYDVVVAVRLAPEGVTERDHRQPR